MDHCQVAFEFRCQIANTQVSPISDKQTTYDHIAYATLLRHLSGGLSAQPFVPFIIFLHAIIFHSLRTQKSKCLLFSFYSKRNVCSSQSGWQGVINVYKCYNDCMLISQE